MNLSALKAKTLQHIAFLTGAPTAGTKASIISDLQTSLHQPRLAKNATRILSVDMGIRNLAYCVIDVPPQPPSAAAAAAPNAKTTLHAIQWKRLDLLSRLSSTSPSPNIPSPTTESARSDSTPSFTPTTMSRAALAVAHDLLAHRPDAILIERQRFRSNGSAAIQEWTLRVNTLESMLWACLETLRSVRCRAEGGFPALHECSPKRVAGFWAAGARARGVEGGLLGEGLGGLEEGGGAGEGGRRAKKAAEVKREKIAVLRSWLDGSGGVELVLEGETEVTARAFAQGVRRRGAKARREGEGGLSGRETKLDDLADCMLQGAAWVRWEENRRAVLRAFEEQSRER